MVPLTGTFRKKVKYANGVTFVVTPFGLNGIASKRSIRFNYLQIN